MDQNKSLEEAELANGVVRRHDRLATLLAGNAHTNISLLNHGYIVGAVTNGQRHYVEPISDKLNDGSLLRRTDSTTEH